jgi:hypothetical protein
MFTWLVIAIEALGKFLFQICDNVLKVIVGWFRFSWAAIAVVVGAIGMSLAQLWGLLHLCQGAFNSAENAVQGATLTGGGVYSGVAFLNYCFPIQETLAFVLTYFNIWVAFAVYKFIKSWLPKVAGFGFG